MGRKKKPKFKCKSEAQKRAIAANYARKKGHVEVPYPHFRYYKKSKHPALIVGEQKGFKQTPQGVKDIDEYKYRKVTHSERDGRHLNEKVYPNPNPKDNNPMYIGKRVRHDEKENFEEYPLPWKYPKK